ncbi:MAG: hypothetical protein EWM72_01291 [Nitrospira sp.]|nr:MAG: hypothetical protein EWM72_01291 [Nitrospira sp.]
MTRSREAYLEKTVSREASLVKRVSKRPSLVMREAYLADDDHPDRERRDTRYERRFTNHACQLKSL